MCEGLDLWAGGEGGLSEVSRLGGASPAQHGQSRRMCFLE